MRSARCLQNASAANVIARACAAEADVALKRVLVDLDAAQDHLSEAVERVVELQDRADELMMIAIAAAEIICKTDADARQHALVEKAKTEIASFVADRRKARAA